VAARKASGAEISFAVSEPTDIPALGVDATGDYVDASDIVNIRLPRLARQFPATATVDIKWKRGGPE